MLIYLAVTRLNDVIMGIKMANGEKFRRKKNKTLDQRCKPNAQLRAGALWRAKRKKKTKK